MTNTKHTPGPWIQCGYDITTPEGLFPIAKLNPVLDINVIEANARLIAAAPELLEALELVYRRMANDDKLQVRLATGIKYGHERECEECALFLDIQNLIAKAKGE